MPRSQVHNQPACWLPSEDCLVCEINGGYLDYVDASQVSGGALGNIELACLFHFGLQAGYFPIDVGCGSEAPRPKLRINFYHGSRRVPVARP